jgi:hypothetical protein
LNKKNSTKLAFLISTLMGTSIAQAQSMNNSTNFYVGADLGYSSVSDNSQQLANALVTSVGGSATVTQNTGVAIGRLFGGYKINENFALELGYGASSNVNYSFSGISRSSVAYTGSASESIYGLDYAVVVRPSVSTK